MLPCHTECHYGEGESLDVTAPPPPPAPVPHQDLDLAGGQAASRDDQSLVETTALDRTHPPTSHYLPETGETTGGQAAMGRHTYPPTTYIPGLALQVNVYTMIHIVNSGEC